MDNDEPLSDSTPTSAEEALQQVLLVERRARNALKDAESEARRLVEVARARALEIDASSRERVRVEVAALQTVAQQETAAQTTAILTEADEEANQWVEQATARLDAALAAVLDVVTLRSEH